MSAEKLEQIDQKLDNLIVSVATLTQLTSSIKEDVDDHEGVLYGCKQEPGIISQVQSTLESMSKIKKIALAAVTAAITGFVGFLFKELRH